MQLNKLDLVLLSIALLFSILTGTAFSQADFVVSNVSAPAQAAPGDMVSVTFTIENIGTQMSSPGRIEIRLSVNSTITSSDDLLLSYDIGTIFFPGGSLTSTKSVQIPASTKPATLYIGVIVDALNAVAEVKEGNNTGFTPILVDFPPAITVTSPSAGSDWSRGSTHTILWNTQGDAGTTVAITLYRGSNPEKTISSGTANDGSFSWTVGTGLTAASDYKVRVQSTAVPAADDYSDTFTISDPPVITVINPHTGTVWQMGTAYSIQWTNQGNTGSNVRIELYKGGAYQETIHAATSNIGLFSWTVGTKLTAGSDYQIRVKSTTVTAADDYSDYFTISDPPSITVNTPNSSSTWQKGTTHTIHWTPLGSTGSTVKIELFKAGAFLQTLSSSTANDSYYIWHVSNSLVAGSDYQVRVASTTVSSADGYSALFTISEKPIITITNPTASSNWQKGSNQLIKWTSQNNAGSSVQIRLYKSGSYVSTIAASTNNDGSYSWGVPTNVAASSSYQIRINSTSSGADDYSDNFTIANPPSLTVTNPGSGSNWQKGSAYSIQWTSQGASGANVKIRLYKGGSYLQTITSSTANDDSYAWTVPSNLVAGSDYQMRVSSTTSSSADDYGDNFTISNPPSLTVTKPTASSNWQKGSAYTIQWSSQGTTGANVKIRLYKGGTYQLTVNASAANNGSYSWNVPTSLTAAGDYQIRVNSTTVSSADDYSDNFAISDIPSITVVTPDANSTWQKNSGHAIQWTSQGDIGSSVQVRLYKGGSYQQTLAASTPDDGSFAWIVPTSLAAGGDYQIRVTSTTVPSADDTSDNFTISDIPSITVVAPDANSNWFKGSGHTIQWTSQGSAGSSVKIRLYKGGNYLLTVNSNTSNDGSYPWNVPTSLASGSDYQMRITSTTVSSADDYSDNFTISSAPSLTVTVPNSSSSWNKGAAYTIQWTSQGTTGRTVKIRLYQGGNYLQTIASGTGNSGLYSWNVPTSLAAASDYQIRVNSTTVPSADDYSGNFTVVDAPVIVVVAPTSSDDWAMGTVHKIRWTTQGNAGGNVKVRLYKAGGYLQDIISSAANTGIYSWNVPAGIRAGADYQIRVTSTTIPEANDYSDPFTISHAPHLTVTNPNASSNWEKGLSYSIKWATQGNTGRSVAIKLYKNGGFAQAIVSNSTNDGEYAWTVPFGLAAASDYQVRVTSTTVQAADDYSATFTVSDPPPAITILQPDSLTTWYAGERDTILWANQGDTGDQVTISLLKGGQWVADVDGQWNAATNNDGKFVWQVPTEITPGDDYQIHVASTTVSAADDRSAFFAISGTMIEFIAPDSASAWQKGRQYWIDWQTHGQVPYVQIRLYKGDSFLQTIADTTYNFDGLSWTVPPSLASASDYRIRITGLYASTADAYSDTFSVIDRQGPIVVLQPNYSSTWYRGTDYTVEWNAQPNTGAQVEIQLYKGNTPDQGSQITDNDGSFVWYVSRSRAPGSDYRFLIASTTVPSASGFSDFFTISDSPITVTAPASYSNWDRGEEHTIQWSNTGDAGNHVMIRLYRSNDFVQTIADSTPNDGNLPWTVPTTLTPAEDYQIRVTSTTVPGADDFSDYFSIAVVPTITISQPDSTCHWQQGSEHDIRWWTTGNIGNYVRIVLYRQGSYLFALAEKTENDGVYTWTLPTTNLHAGDDYQIHIVNTDIYAGGRYEDLSDMFTIGHATSVDTKSDVIPDEFALLQNFPNPFNPETSITFTTIEAAHVKLTIYDILGNPVRALLDEPRPAGAYSIQWDGRNDAGNSVASGVYIYKLQAGSNVAARKMLFIK